MSSHRLVLSLLVVVTFMVAVVKGRTIDDILLRASNSTRQRQGSPIFSPDGRGMLEELDIMVQRGQRRLKRNAVGPNQYWTNGEIPYTLDMTSGRAEIQSAIDAFDKYTCIKWVPRSTQPDFVAIKDLNGCWSYVGKIGNGQDMSLGNGCVTKRIIIHEMMHAAGVFHQHNRADRNTYITVNTNNIQSGLESQFAISQSALTYGFPYSYRSIMHYGRRAFTKDGSDTITTKDSFYQDIIGTAPTFDFEDIRLLSRMYDCPKVGKPGGCTSKTCPAEGFHAFDCKCYCPSGVVSDPVKLCDSVGTTTTTATTTPTGTTTTAQTTTDTQTTTDFWSTGSTFSWTTGFF